MHFVCVLLTIPFIFQNASAKKYGYKGSVACDPADPIPLREISLKQIIGSWTCIYCTFPKGYRLDITLTSFDLIVSNTFPNGSASGEFRGRFIDSCQCVNSGVRFETTNKPNTFREISELSKNILGDVVPEWRFLDKMGNYMLGTHCFEFDKYNRCTRFFANIFSKSNNEIPLEILKRLNQSARKTLCLDIFEDFIKWPTGNACPAVKRTSDPYTQ